MSGPGVKTTAFAEGLVDNAAEQEGVSGQVRTRARFLTSAHFSETGNKEKELSPRKQWEIRARCCISEFQCRIDFTWTPLHGTSIAREKG